MTDGFELQWSEDHQRPKAVAHGLREIATAIESMETDLEWSVEITEADQ